MNDRIIKDRLANHPTIESTWTCKDETDTIYTVKMIANLEFKLPYQPLTVIYQDADNQWLAMSLIVWRLRMKEIKK